MFELCFHDVFIMFSSCFGRVGFLGVFVHIVLTWFAAVLENIGIVFRWFDSWAESASVVKGSDHRGVANTW